MGRGGGKEVKERMGGKEGEQKGMARKICEMEMSKSDWESGDRAKGKGKVKVKREWPMGQVQSAKGQEARDKGRRGKDEGKGGKGKKEVAKGRGKAKQIKGERERRRERG